MDVLIIVFTSMGHSLSIQNQNFLNQQMINLSQRLYNIIQLEEHGFKHHVLVIKYTKPKDVKTFGYAEEGFVADTLMHLHV